MSEHMSPIPSRLYNAAVGGHVCGPEDVDFGQKVVHLVKYDRAGNEVSFESQVTQANKIYVIHDDFTLTSNVTIPANCVLEFDGGSVSGQYNLTGTNTVIKAGLVKIFNINVTLAGTWNIAEAYPEWFGAVGDGVTDDSAFINKCQSISNIIKLSSKTYLVATDITFSSNCTGNGDTVLLLDNACIKPNITISYDHKITFRDIRFTQQNDTEFIVSGYVQCMIFENCEFRNLTDVCNSTQHSEWMGLLTFKKCTFDGIYGTVLKCGNDLNAVDFDSCRILNTVNTIKAHRLFNVSIHNCDIERTNIFDDRFGGAFNCFDVSIENCYIETQKYDNNDADVDAAFFKLTNSTPTGNVIVSNCYIAINKGHIVNTYDGESYQWEVRPLVFTFRNCGFYDLSGSNSLIFFKLKDSGSSANSQSIISEYSIIYIYNTTYGGFNEKYNILNYCNKPENVKYKLRIWDYAKNRWMETNNMLDSYSSNPSNNFSIPVGYHYFNTTLNKPIYWTGSAWVDASGNAV